MSAFVPDVPNRIPDDPSSIDSTSGATLVEILHDCPIFNDGSFDALRKEDTEERVINVQHGEPIVFGASGEYCVVS